VRENPNKHPPPFLIFFFFFFSINRPEKPGARPGSNQRGCCRNWGESTEDDVFEQDARRERSKKPTGAGGDDEKGVKGNESEGGDKPVNEQPLASPEMTAPATEVATDT
jgi:hypothetical protein